jgi:Protein of unknown function (DUF3987)
VTVALSDLIAETRWVAWRNESRDGRLTKVPYVAVDRRAEADDPTNWLPHDQAAILGERIINNFGGGVGIELGSCGNLWLAGVDLDTCRHPKTGKIERWATTVLDRLDTYAEISPSGSGVKAFCAIAPEDVGAARELMGVQHGRVFKRANGSAHPPAIELHISNRYFTVTWNGLDDYPTELRTIPLSDLKWLIQEAGPSLAGKANSDHAKAGDDADTILARLERAAAGNQAVHTGLMNAGTMKGGSRSEGAFGLGAALKRAGWSFADMKAALLACPATKEWAEEKLAAEGDRQFDRVWQRARLSDPREERAHGADEWPEPLDFLADHDLTGTPTLRTDHLPDAIAPFVFDVARRMGVDPAVVALSALVSLASVISEDWCLQPKQYDYDWTENARIWGAIVGDPSMLKTPIIKAVTAPIDRLEVAARQEHADAMRRYKLEMKQWKDNGANPESEPTMPRLDRYMVEGTTIEALSEVLRDDMDARQRAPAGKVLIRQDEMSEWLGSFDRYRAGGRGGSDRGAYIRLYNGGRYTIDRIGRGSFAASSWSACILGGIQPGPIQQIARDAADDGLLQRFCYVVPTQQGRGEDRAPDKAAAARYEALFPALTVLRPSRSFSGYPRPVALHAEAHQHRHHVNDLAEALAAMPDASNRLKSALGKWPGLFARLTLTFHLIQLADARASGERPISDVVQPKTARPAAAYMRDILLPHLLRADALMFATEQTGHARWIAGYILAKGLAEITVRDVVRAYGALRAPERRRDLLDVLASLEPVGWIRPTTSTNPTHWTVNPRVHELFAKQAQAARATREETKRRIAEAVARFHDAA